MRSRTHVQARAPRVIAKILSWLKCSFGFFHRMLQKNQKIKIKKQLLLFGQPKSNNWFGGAKKCLEGLLTGTPYICLPRTASPHGPGKEEGTSSSWTFQSCRSIHGNNLVPLSSKLCHPNSQLGEGTRLLPGPAPLTPGIRLRAVGWPGLYSCPGSHHPPTPRPPSFHFTSPTQ